jgi:serine/threonine protein kinase
VVASNTAALVGTSVGRYRLERLLGQGGMGSVYLAVQPDIGAKVAIKVISLERANDPTLTERLFAEARAVNVIQHEHIVNIIDLTKLDDGRPAIVMEYLAGAPLHHVLRRYGTLPIGNAVDLILETLSALGAAHEAGIIHRDFKPPNLVVTPEGHAKVVDFGIAKFLTDSPTSTMTGHVLGTVPYMSPEQATGAPLDGRSDLFAVGVVLYECLIGERPFPGQNIYELLREFREGPPALCELRPNLPKELEAVVLRSLAVDEDDRFQTAGEMADALQAVRDELPKDAWRELDTSPVDPELPKPGELASTEAAAPPPEREAGTRDMRTPSSDAHRTAREVPSAPRSKPAQASEVEPEHKAPAPPTRRPPSRRLARDKSAWNTVVLLFAGIGIAAVIFAIIVLVRGRDEPAEVAAVAVAKVTTDAGAARQQPESGDAAAVNTEGLDQWAPDGAVAAPDAGKAMASPKTRANADVKPEKKVVAPVDDIDKLDAIAWLPEATKRAKTMIPDPVPYGIRSYVLADGTTGRRSATYHFFSPSLSKRKGAKWCGARVEAGRSKVIVYPLSRCKTPPRLKLPKCSSSALWQVAKNAGFKEDRYNLECRRKSGLWRLQEWGNEIRNNPDCVVDHSFDDVTEYGY